MIHLRFEGGASGPDVIIGPAPWFRIAGNSSGKGRTEVLSEVFVIIIGRCSPKDSLGISARTPIKCTLKTLAAG